MERNRSKLMLVNGKKPSAGNTKQFNIFSFNKFFSYLVNHSIEALVSYLLKIGIHSCSSKALTMSLI